MADGDALKLLPRNVAAFRRGRSPVPRHPIVNGIRCPRVWSPPTVGNCFPGLECDLRNLERRFFPYLEVDFLPVRMGNDTVNGIVVAGVDQAGVSAGGERQGLLTAAQAQVYRQIAAAPEIPGASSACKATLDPSGRRPCRSQHSTRRARVPGAGPRMRGRRSASW